MSRKLAAEEDSHPEQDQSNSKTERKRKTSEHQKETQTQEETCQLSEDASSPLVPAISHKEKRKRRKLEQKKTLDKSIEDDPIAVPTMSSRKVETIFTTTSRTKHGVWVGNLLFTTTPQELAQFLEGAGPIVRLNMPTGKREHEANTGFAYVDFATPEAVDAALQKSESLLGGRKLLIKRSSDYSGRPDPATTTHATISSSSSTSIPPPTLSKSVRKILDHQKQPPAPCIYFGNLGFNTTSEGIVTMLHAHHQAQQVWNPKPKMTGKDEDEDEEEHIRGKSKPENRLTELGIRKVRMGTFEDTGKCKGFAFVDFETVDQATKVLMNLKNHHLDGRKLTVEYASVEAVKRGGGSVRSMGQHKRSDVRSTTTRGPSHQVAPKKSPASNASRPRAPPDLTSHIIVKEIHPPPPMVEELPRKPKKEFLGRQKPGAALANAQRAPTGIIKNPEIVGKKTVFT
ncbi:hypothetical protein PCANC_09591 [Puccinia coronata f. sp. avenae]|uniref:RRM domain-containing protein n=1 Tax=Puccinia coronata f. sp. avenae TaxID=200324 RepID=A0A2N5SN59_9BASI|nr:hypothetical protein PCANC_18353 [Puccinia coronata f. sp. avenae]PLW46762.1 hypothetical protein PCANC_09591 [Puccinia coronata f. sp. avenae]